MKRFLLLILVVFGLTTGWAQAPYQFNFQAVARNLAGNPMTNATVDFRLSIVQGDPEGAVVYIETQNTQTNNFGLANLLVGSGVADLGSLATLDWMAGPYFLRIELADNDGNYLLVGSSPLMSVPYALHAKTSEQAGPQGPPGEQGPQGENGMSAYEVWLSLGNEGTVAEFLNSLKGESGAQGAQGPAGQDGVGIFTTITNDNGSFTLVFTDGSSYTTPSLVGPQGAQGLQGEPGPIGPQGEQGADGTDGVSAYETWLSLGNSGSEEDFIASLTGPQGEPGLTPIDVTLSNDSIEFTYANGLSVGSPFPQGNSSSGVPIGTIVSFGGSEPPAGWFFCDGSELSITDYQELYDVIGTLYGAGDSAFWAQVDLPATTFDLPNLQGRVPVGAGVVEYFDAGAQTAKSEVFLIGEKGGEVEHTLTISEMPSHNHQITRNANGGGGASPAATGGSNGNPWQTSFSGGDSPHSLMQPYVVFHYIIKCSQ